MHNQVSGWSDHAFKLWHLLSTNIKSGGGTIGTAWVNLFDPKNDIKAALPRGVQALRGVALPCVCIFLNGEIVEDGTLALRSPAEAEEAIRFIVNRAAKISLPPPNRRPTPITPRQKFSTNTDMRTAIYKEMARITRPVDAYIRYIIGLPIEFHIQGIPSRDEAGLKNLMYVFVLGFVKTVIRWADHYNYQDGCVLMWLGSAAGAVALDFKNLPDAIVDQFIEKETKKILMDDLFAQPATLDFAMMSNLLEIAAKKNTHPWGNKSLAAVNT